jgi:HTH-type transcriptional regulator/antitoxin HigA
MEDNKQQSIPLGATIKENLKEINMSHSDFAERIGITETHAGLLIKGEIEVTPKIAKKLSNIIGASPKFWLNLDSNYKIKKTNNGR